jgi:hypothetical protein
MTQQKIIQPTAEVASAPTAPTATLTVPQTTFNLPEDYFNVSVHIISKLIIEKDYYPVPHDERVVEVKVPEISLDKVVDALSRVINIHDYQIFSLWQTEIEDPHVYKF